ncbi:bifunctional diguanylate cyclase/phosphodiesterase [Photobacterium nomapromontoriensis]|uniref:bifunctional diguanylate cyclase/phosphodiesterase n=1 Tax=Photobacterium nomapromontoriensis TaxID=2910237 RepID=UPI003D14A4F1
MTLYSRLFLWLLVLFTLLLGGIFYSQLTTTRSYLVEQQTVELDNAIHAVGLALSSYLKENDPVAIESVLNAMFDGSYYQQVVLDIFTPPSQIERHYAITPNQVPALFVQWIDIPTITRKNTLTSGWMQLATITIKSQPAIAYSKLWQSSLELLTTFLGCFMVGLVLLKLILDKLVKQPLSTLQMKARAIARHEFDPPLAEPTTRELKDVVIAFNHMSFQLEQYITQQAQQADILRKRAYQDPESGLGNRRLLLLQLEDWLEQMLTGGAIIIKASAIQHYIDTKSFDHAAKLTQAFGHKLLLLVAPTIHVGRLSPSEFLLIISNKNPQALTDLAHETVNQLVTIQQACSPDIDSQIWAGIVVKPSGDDEAVLTTVPQLLAQCDNALALALQHSDNIALLDDASGAIQNQWGKQQWLDLCHQAVVNNTITLIFQSARLPTGKELHQEVFSTITRNGRDYRAGQFLPALEALNETTFFDRYMITKAGDHLLQYQHHNPHIISINLTNHSIQDTGFIQWLDIYLTQHPTISQQLIFELPESAFIYTPDPVNLLCHILDKHHFSYGIDNYGYHFSSVSYLRQYRPRYVKLDFAYTRKLDDEIQRDALNALTRTARSLDILTIATRVETPQQVKILTSLGIDGIQGFAMASQKDRDVESNKRRNTKRDSGGDHE